MNDSDNLILYIKINLTSNFTMLSLFLPFFHFLHYFKRIKIAIPKKNNKRPITIKTIFRIFVNPKLASGNELLEVVVGVVELLIERVVLETELLIELVIVLLIESSIEFVMFVVLLRISNEFIEELVSVTLL